MYKCTMCDAEFMKKKELKEHIELEHTDHDAVNTLPSNTKCLYCKKEFKSGAELKRHITVCSSNPANTEY